MSLFLAKPQRFLVRPAPGWLDMTLTEVQEILASPLQKYKFAPQAADEGGLVTVSDCDYRQALELVCRLTTVHDVDWVLHSGRVQSRADWSNFLEKSGLSSLWEDHPRYQFHLSAQVSHPVVGTEREIKDLAKATCPFLSEDMPENNSGTSQRVLQRIRLESNKNRQRVLVSMGGEPLYKRGYKRLDMTASAPLPEHHASACFMWASKKFTEYSRGTLEHSGCSFVVPFAGTGTTGFEAIARSLNIAPALTRTHFACEDFAFHPLATMATIRQRLRLAVFSSAERFSLVFGDINDEVISRLPREVEGFCSAAQLSLKVNQNRNDFLVEPLDLFTGIQQHTPLFLPMNPPFGSRLAKASGGDVIYRKLADSLRKVASSWRIGGYVICPDESTWKILMAGLAAFDCQTTHFTHGGQDMRIVAFKVR